MSTHIHGRTTSMRSNKSDKSLWTKSTMPHMDSATDRSRAPTSKEPSPTPGSVPPRLWPNISESRLWIINISLWISLLASTIDTTIVTTALLPISTELPSTLSPTWLLVVYLLTYTSFLLVSTSFSDIFGIKAVLLFCNVNFLMASLACSLATSMKQLIGFRAWQGMAASGLYNLPFVVVLKVVEPDRVTTFTTWIGVVFIMANFLGPVLGGLLGSIDRWRVIFGMNLPLMTLALVLLFMAAPEEPGPFINRKKLRRMDWLGALLSIGWAAPLILALQEGGDMWSWKSVTMTGLLVAGGLGLLLFVVYEAFVISRFNKDPVLPCSIFRTAPVFWLMVNALFIGVTFYGAIILLPYRFQVVNDKSARDSGFILLLMTLTVPIGAWTGAKLSHRHVYGAEWIALAGCIMVFIGTVLLAYLPAGTNIPLTSWFAQIHLGIGFGLLGAIALFVQKDHTAYEQIASCLGIYDMIRAMGGTIGVAICSAIVHGSLRKELGKVLPENKVRPLMVNFASVSSLDLQEQRLARDSYGKVFSVQFRALAVAAGINVVIALLMVWSRRYKNFSMEKRGASQHQSWRELENGPKKKEEDVQPADAPNITVPTLRSSQDWRM